MEDESKPRKEKEAARPDIDALMSQVRELTRQVSDMKSGVIDLERTKDHTCNLRLWDGKIVTNVTKSWNERKPGSNETLPYVGIYLKDEKEPLSVTLPDFYRNTVYLECRIKEVRLKDPGVVAKGTVEVRDVSPDGYKTIGTGVRVPMRVVSPRNEYLVVTPDGEELLIPEEAIN